MSPVPPPALGRLTAVELRDAWPGEATDFTPWLAGEENLALLGDVLGLELELIDTEKDVGPYRADIVCKDTADGSWVLVENQLARTDHTHLGQILTYAAGLSAVHVVWIARRFTDEHRAALDWLNENTNENLRFFGLEIELWKIGDSPSAPKFNVVCSPNDWVKGAQKRNFGTGELSQTKRLQLDFWTGFASYLVREDHRYRIRTPWPATWVGFALGRSGFTLQAVASSWDEDSKSSGKWSLRVELVVADGPRFFDLLCDQADAIHEELGFELTWHQPASAKNARAWVRREADLEDRDVWPACFDWLATRLNEMRQSFSSRAKELPF